MMNISRITLGTAQLGYDYGIANQNGKPDFHSSMEILQYAYDNGINTFDTAPTYGDSEEIIGSFISSGPPEIKKSIVISSKLPPINRNLHLNFDEIYKFIKENITPLIPQIEKEGKFEPCL